MMESTAPVITGFMPWSLIWALPYLGALVLAILYLMDVENEKIYGWGAVASIGASAMISTLAAFRV
ncbi:MAG: hypothetical protein GSR78_02220, partial [Desulfurococcales archaeon]|nr:hypothetical protein [Desulfurococcales archaeon]